MSQPAEPQASPLAPQAVIEELGSAHGATIARLTEQLAMARALLRQQDEEIRYLRSLQPPAAADETAAG